MAATATYIYCVVQRATCPSLARAPKGLEGASKLTLLTLDRSMWAVVADVPLAVYGGEALETSLRDLQWVGETAMAHETVVEHFARLRGATVIPMKLLTMFSTPERLVAEMTARLAEMRAVVRRIKGCHEWGVRVARRTSALPSAPQVGQRSGVAFLEAKRRARDAAREAAQQAGDAAERAYEMLQRLSRAAVRRADVPAGAPAPPLLDAAFLVPVAKHARFRSMTRRAAALCKSAGADLRVTGPWPAYNFAQVTEGPP